MKQLLRRLRSTAGAGEQHIAPGEGEATESFEWSTAATGLVSRATTYALRGCLVAGVLALVGVVLLMTQTPTTQPAPTSTTEEGLGNERAAVSAFAEDFVTTWLTTTSGQEGRLESYMPIPSDLTLPEQPWQATDVGTAGLTRTEQGPWAVTVAVDVGAGKAPTTRRYFQVPVVYDTGQLVAAALPAPVAAPRMAPTVELAYGSSVPLEAAVSQAAGDFLAALLTGEGDVTRFISPDAPIAPVLPPPYRTVSLSAVEADQGLTSSDEEPESGREVRLLITATATVDKARETTVQYALTMRAREGRWEVAIVDLAPRPASNEPAAPAEGASP